MAPTARNSGLTGGGLQSSCSTASNGRNSTPLCRQRLPGAASGPPYASISSATTKPWCSAWCPAGHTARTSCPSSATSFLPPPCTISPYPQKHIPGMHNILADSLSRFHMQIPRTCPTSLAPPNPHPHLSSLQQDVRLYLHHSLATSTRSTFNAATCNFINFTLTYSQLHPNGSLMLYASFLARTLKLQSIKVYLSAVRNLHLEHGLPDPPMSDALNLRRLMRGIKRVHGGPADHRLPITPNLFHSFRRFLVLSHPDHLTLWEALLLAFFGFLRSNELLSIKLTDLTRIAEGYQVRIRASKTDPFRMGATIGISPTGDPSLCPVPVLDSLTSATGQREGPLFCLQTGVPLNRPRLNRLVRELAARSGAPTKYSSHSFRIGAALAAAAVGIPEWQIQALGRWSTDCYKRYIRLPSSTTDTLAAAIATVPL